MTRHCQICRAAMCERQCDYGAWVHYEQLSTCAVDGGGLDWARHMYDQTFSPEYRVWQEAEVVESPGPFGYALTAPAEAAGRLVMPLQKLGAALRRKHGPLRHVCEPCVLGAAAEAIDLVVAGEFCQTPFCERKPEGACACCDGAFCRGCVTSGGYSLGSVTCAHRLWPVIYSQASGQADADLAFPAGEKYPPAGLCVPCARERLHFMREAAARILDGEYASRLVPLEQSGAAAFMVPARSRRTSGGRATETRRSREAARGYAAEITQRAHGAVTGAPCRRSPSYHPGGLYAPHTGYVLVGPPPPAQTDRS